LRICKDAIRGSAPLTCPQCGTSLPDNTPFCTVCGRAQTMATVPSAATGTPFGVPPSETSGKAIASLILGIVPFSLLSSIPAVVFGHLALSEIKKSGGRLRGRGLAIAGLVLGYLTIAMVPFILIIAAIAIPNLLRARIAANESGAIGSLRLLATAEGSYSTSHPGTGYSCDLREVAAASDLAASLGRGHHEGYNFAARNCTPQSAGGPNIKYQIYAYPERARRTGVRAFCVDESGIVRSDGSGSFEDCLDHGNELR